MSMPKIALTSESTVTMSSYISNNYSTTRIQDLIISDSNIAQLGLTSARVSSKSELGNMVLIDSEDNT